MNLLYIGGLATVIAGLFFFLGMAFPLLAAVPLLGFLTKGIVLVVAVGILSFGLMPNPAVLVIPLLLALLIWTTSGVSLI